MSSPAAAIASPIAATRRRELVGVGEQIQQDLFEPAAVAVHPNGAGRDTKVEALVTGLEQARHGGASFASEANPVESTGLECQRPGPEAGEIQHIGHQALHALGAPRDPLKELLAGAFV